jgi:L-cystine uptake protein TcyP (sodium:dicarboxylate symporter family)
MARTSLNVNGSMTAGVLTSRLVKSLPDEAKDSDVDAQPQTASD